MSMSMDKYLVRTPRIREKDGVKPEPEKAVTQATIESLKGVVVIEDIWRLKAILKLPDQTSENLLVALKELQKKIPSRGVLKTTKIGHTVNRLTKNKDAEVSLLAGEIVKHWKTHFERKADRPLIEVKCDAKTEKLRAAGRKLLAVALDLPEKHSFPEVIEREAFLLHKRLASNAYRKTMRTLVFTLKHKEPIRAKVLSKELQIPDFVSQHKKDVRIPSSATS